MFGFIIKLEIRNSVLKMRETEFEIVRHCVLQVCGEQRPGDRGVHGHREGGAR